MTNLDAQNHLRGIFSLLQNQRLDLPLGDQMKITGSFQALDDHFSAQIAAETPAAAPATPTPTPRPKRAQTPANPPSAHAS
jgi:hypothetical protein